MKFKGLSILLIEDHEDILYLNRQVLEQHGFYVLCATTIAQAQQLMEQETVHLIVLDILLPDGSGLDFCAEIREQSTVPILILSCLRTKKQVVSGLITGSDDYITKPYRMDEFLARVHSLLRREQMHEKQLATQAPERFVSCGKVKLDTMTARAFLDNNDVGLTPKEFALLLLLIQNEGLVVSNHEISKILWDNYVPNDMRAIWTHISNLRNKLRILPSSRINITAQRGKGYLFTHQ